MNAKKIPPSVSAYLAKNGAKGGKTKGPTKARDPEKMSAAANKRWGHEKSAITFSVYHPGEMGAGLRGFSDDVKVSCGSEDWGGAPGEFAEYMRDCLKEWYDGATVTIERPELKRRFKKLSKLQELVETEFQALGKKRKEKK